MTTRDTKDHKKAESLERVALEYAENIAATAREPLLVLDGEMRVVSANRSFFQTFQVTAKETEKRLLYEVGNHQWDIPALRKLLEEIIPKVTQVDNFEITHEFPKIGRKVMLLNARRMRQPIKNTPLILLAIEDITERKKAETERDRLFNLSLDMQCTAGFDGYFKQLNPAWEKTLGWTNEELMSKPYLEFVHPDDRESTIGAASGLTEGKAAITFENRYLCKDGSYKWISWNSFPLVGEKLVFAVVRDVTGRKQTEDELREYRTHLEEMVEKRTAELKASNEQLQKEITKRAETEEELRRVNRTLKTLSGCNQTIIRATKESDLPSSVCRTILETGGYRLVWVGFAEHDEEKTVRPVAQAGYEEGYLETTKPTWADTKWGRGSLGRAIRTGKPSITGNILTDPNHILWRAEASKRGYASQISLPLIANGQTLGALNIYAAEPDAFDTDEVKLLTELAGDLTYGIVALRAHAERERAEEKLVRSEKALREGEQKYSTMLQKGNDGIIVVQDGLLKFVNQKMSEITGFALEETIGRAFVELVSPAFREPVADTYKKRMAGAKVPDKYEIEVLSKDGKNIPVEISASLIEYEGRPADMAIIRDMTERKDAEVRLRESIYRMNNISLGDCYLHSSHDMAYRIFSQLVLHGVPGLCISREKPEKLMQHDIPKENILILSSVALKGFETIESLQDISLRISGFLKDHKAPVVLLDGLTYMISRSSFETVYKFIQEKRFNFIEAEANLIMPVDQTALSDKEKALLASEVKLL